MSNPTNSDSEIRWAISSNEEIYHHNAFDTRDAAISEGISIYEGEPFYIARCEPPTKPEEIFNASDWLDQVSCQDDYMGDHAEYWDNSTKEQLDELTNEVQKVMAAWLDRHELRPTFWNAVNPEYIDPFTL